MNKLYRQQLFVLMMDTVDIPTTSTASFSTTLVHNLRTSLLWEVTPVAVVSLFRNKKLQTTPSPKAWV